MDLNKIGNFLKELRKEKGYTQQEVADELYVSSKSVSRWENGDGIPDVDTIMDIAKFYQVSVDELINGERKYEIKVNKDKMTSKKIREKLIAKVNVFLIIALSVSGGLFALGLIFGVIFNMLILFLLMMLGFASSIIIYISGIKEIIRRAANEEDILTEDNFYLQHLIKDKNRFFRHVMVYYIAVLFFLLIIIDNPNLAIFGVLGFVLMYFLLTTKFKKELTKEIINKRIYIMLIIYSLLFTIFSFTLSYTKDVNEVIGGLIRQDGSPMIVYTIDCFNYGYQTLKAISIGLFFISVLGSIGTLFIKKNYKVFILITLVIMGFLSNYLPIIDLKIYHSVLIVTNPFMFTVPGKWYLFYLITYLSVYFINLININKKEKNKLTEEV